MAKNITLMGANYSDVPAVQLPKTGGGVATFYDGDEIIKYKDYTLTPDSAIGSGTIGTRGAQKTQILYPPAGYSIVSASIISIGASDKVHPLVFWIGTTLYVNFYRATSDSITTAQASTIVRVVYARAVEIT